LAAKNLGFWTDADIFVTGPLAITLLGR